MDKNSYRISDEFSSEEVNQTDFGRIYYNLPKESLSPSSPEGLAQTLKKCNEAGKPVTIRNTGHSINGQTLTSGTQVSVAGIKQGGLWNHVERLSLVTMTGDIISCSREMNPDIFRYALGGFGRIGVSADITFRVVNGPENVVSLFMVYHDESKYYADVEKALTDPTIDSFVVTESIDNVTFLEKIGIRVKAMWLIRDLYPSVNIDEQIADWRSRYKEDFSLILAQRPDIYFFEAMMKHKVVSKKELIYHYPTSDKVDQLDMLHPWSDHILPIETYPRFMQEARKIIKKYGIEKDLLVDSFYHQLDFKLFGGYPIKNISLETGFDYPLSLNLNNKNPFAMAIGVMPTVPSDRIDKALAVSKEITDMTYEMGGKRYLYCIHDLTKEQVEQHFGRETIEEWQSIKDRLDPKHLLNIGVIEHLDG